MGAKKKWGEKGRWRTIVGVEALKYTPTPQRSADLGSYVDLDY
jgi:hypothetical protein